MQTDYDYELMKEKIKEDQSKVQEFEVVEDVPKDIKKSSENIIPDNIQSDNIKPQVDEKPVEDDEKPVEDDVKKNISEKQSTNNNEAPSQTEKITEKQLSEDVSEEERQNKKEMKKIFINF